MTTPRPNAKATPMTPERWRAVDAVLKAALALPPAERAAFVRDACAEDEALRREVESLLAAHDDVGDDFLERPAVESLAPAARSPEAEALARASLDQLGRALAGRYAIEREIARGGMATVYLARDLRHGRRVAVKVLREAVAATVGAERFLAEIRVTASLQHPHVLPLFDSGSADGLLWYVMPFVEGETLRSRLAREGRVPVPEAVRLAREVADALDHAHARGIVHRDVKPENVLLQDGHALVADFGIALALERAGERLTSTGLTLGTPQYMAPEQASGERTIDARVDVYALGAVLYEMIAGAPSGATGPGRAALQRLGRDEPPPALAALRPDVPPALDAALRRAMATRPEQRFPSAAAFATTLGEALASARDAAVPAAPPLSPVATPVRRGRAVRAAAYTAAIVGFAAGLASGWGLARSPLVQRLTGSSAPTPAPIAAAETPPVAEGDASLVVLDRAGRPQRAIPANRPWTPRFSPDGKRLAYGAFGEGRESSDLWVTDVGTGATRRLTDDDADANDPQWSADGAKLAYSVSASGGKDVATRWVGNGNGGSGGGGARILAARPGVQFPSDWLRDGSALLVTEDAGAGGYDILVQPADGSPARPYAATPASETSARISPDGRWVAYTSDESGRAEVYVDSYPTPGRRVQLSTGGGVHAVWRRDGRELYYWRGDALVAVPLAPAQGSAPPAAAGAESVLFSAPYQAAVNTMYDVSPDGQRFVVVRRR